MAYRVIIPQDITDPGKDYLRERGYEIVIGTGDTSVEAMKAAVAAAVALVGRTS